jgi:hypothetical protein
VTTEHITSAGAGAAIASPFWLPELQSVSEVCAALLPIAGVIWLIVQIATKIIVTRRALKRP